MGANIESHYSKKDLDREIESQRLDEDTEFLNEQLSELYKNDPREDLELLGEVEDSTTEGKFNVIFDTFGLN